jgi:hypothetical protein
MMAISSIVCCNSSTSSEEDSEAEDNVNHAVEEWSGNKKRKAQT